MTRLPAALACAALLFATSADAGCPVDAAPRAAGVLISVQHADGRISAWDASRLRALGVQSWTERRSVEQTASAPAEQPAIRYEGVRLRDLLSAADGADPAHDRTLRNAVFEAVADDGYRALFSWGELFNGSAGEQTIVVLARNGEPLDARQGPLALRALADHRPGPRHIRNLCALRVHRLP